MAHLNVPVKLASSKSAEEDSKSFPATASTADAGTEEVDEAGMQDLSPMRTHEQNGHAYSVADRMSHLVEESDDEDDSKEKVVNHDKLERKELRRQKTSDKPNRLRDRLKRTVSKA